MHKMPRALSGSERPNPTTNDARSSYGPASGTTSATRVLPSVDTLEECGPGTRAPPWHSPRTADQNGPQTSPPTGTSPAKEPGCSLSMKRSHTDGALGSAAGPDAFPLRDPPRPRLRSPPGSAKDDTPRRLLPYAALERIAYRTGRAESRAHGWGSAPHDASYIPLLPPFTRPNEGSSSGRFYSSAPAGMYVDDRVRYTPEHAPPTLVQYGSEVQGSSRAGPYPQQRAHAEYCWSPGSEQERQWKMHTNAAHAYYAVPPRPPYPAPYPYAHALLPRPRSLSPSSEAHGRYAYAPPLGHVHPGWGGPAAYADGMEYANPPIPPRPGVAVKAEDARTERRPADMPGRTTPGGSKAKAKANDFSPPHDMPPKRGGKLPKRITDMLKSWLLSHADHPYPTEEEKRQFCEYTGLDICQISNWVRASFGVTNPSL